MMLIFLFNCSVDRWVVGGVNRADGFVDEAVLTIELHCCLLAYAVARKQLNPEFEDNFT